MTGAPIDLWEGQAVPLWNPEIEGQKRPSITPFLLPGKVCGAVIVCPGGGYVNKAPHEGAPIAQMINAAGAHAFTLDYRVKPYRHPAPLTDAQRAIRYVRAHAKELGVLPDKIAILGFSAGGHLTGSAGTIFDGGDPASPDPVERVSCRPDAFAPCYAVLSFTQHHHRGSADALLGPDAAQAERRLLSLEERVSADTPPCFLWHTAADAGVPVENSLLFAAALSRYKIPFSLHVYPYGRHGIGLGADVPLARDWPSALGAWLDELGFAGGKY